MENEKITEAIKRLDDLGNDLFEKIGTDSYTQRCELHDIKELLKQVNDVEMNHDKVLHKHGINACFSKELIDYEIKAKKDARDKEMKEWAKAIIAGIIFLIVLLIIRRACS